MADIELKTPMSRAVVAYLLSNDERLPYKVMAEDLGANPSLWYIWRRDKPEFENWWRECLQSAFSGHLLDNVHKAIYRRSLRKEARVPRVPA